MKKLIALVALAAAPVIFAQQKISDAHSAKQTELEKQKMQEHQQKQAAVAAEKVEAAEVKTDTTNKNSKALSEDAKKAELQAKPAEEKKVKALKP